MEATFYYVHLADDEWGSETMQRVAREIADARPHLEHIVVEVFEHAGWWLRYYADGPGLDDMVIIASANGRGVYPDRARAIQDRFAAEHKAGQMVWRYRHLPKRESQQQQAVA